MPEIHKAAGIILKDKKLLVVRSRGKSHFFAPGGKLEQGETHEQALVRELKEELMMELADHHYEHFGSFSAEADDKPGIMLHMTVFLIKDYDGPLAPDSEIEELSWVDANNSANVPMGSIFAYEVLPRLVAKGLVV